MHKGFWRCLRLDFAGRLFDAALPTNIGGDVVRVRLASDTVGMPHRPPWRSYGARCQHPGAPAGDRCRPGGTAGTSTTAAGGGRSRSSCLAGGAVLAVILMVGHWVWCRQRIPLPARSTRCAGTEAARAQAADGTHPFRRATLARSAVLDRRGAQSGLLHQSGGISRPARILRRGHRDRQRNLDDSHIRRGIWAARRCFQRVAGSGRGGHGGARHGRWAHSERANPPVRTCRCAGVPGPAALDNSSARGSPGRGQRSCAGQHGLVRQRRAPAHGDAIAHQQTVSNQQ